MEPVNGTLRLSITGSGDASTSQQPARVYLQLLPPELRNMVYNLCLVSPTPISFNGSTAYITCDQLENPLAPPARRSDAFNTFIKHIRHQEHKNPLPLLASPKALLDTCRQIRNEASGLYYALNTFEFPSAASFLTFATVTPSVFIPLIPSLRLTILYSELTGSRTQFNACWRLLCTDFKQLTPLKLKMIPTRVKARLTSTMLLDMLLEIPHLRTIELGAYIQPQKGVRTTRGLINNMLERNMVIKGWEAEINQVISERA